MRIISGIAKGRRINAPKGVKIRPTSDRVKEAIFNTITPLINNSEFLDLFAGTGNIGIEALSRGATRCTFVDQSPQAIKFIKANIANLAFEDRSRIIKGDVRKITDRLEGNYDIIFMDPPYGCDLVLPVLKKLNLLLKEAGIVVVETEHKIELPSHCDMFRLIKVSRYGDTQVAYYELN